MRDDMDKLLCERERTGSREYNPRKGYDRRTRARDYEDEYDRMDAQPRHESMTRRLLGETRSFNENLEPLRRFLEKQVGRPWDKIKSEMTKIVGRESVVHRHVWQHVQDFVSEDVVVVDGKLFWRQTWRWGSKHLIPLDRDCRSVYLYVDPRTGILRRHRQWGSGYGKKAKKANKKRREQEILDRRRETDNPLIQLHKIKGIWWEVILAPYGLTDQIQDLLVEKPCEAYRLNWYDPASPIGIRPTRAMQECYGRAGVQGVRKRQLSSKEMKRYGIRND